MMVVIDPGAAIEISLYRTNAEEYIHFIKDSLWVGSPDLFISESTNVFWKYHQFQGLPAKLPQTLDLGRISDGRIFT